MPSQRKSRLMYNLIYVQLGLDMAVVTRLLGSKTPPEDGERPFCTLTYSFEAMIDTFVSVGSESQ